MLVMGVSSQVTLNPRLYSHVLKVDNVSELHFGLISCFPTLPVLLYFLNTVGFSTVR